MKYLSYSAGLLVILVACLFFSCSKEEDLRLQSEKETGPYYQAVIVDDTNLCMKSSGCYRDVNIAMTKRDEMISEYMQQYPEYCAILKGSFTELITEGTIYTIKFVVTLTCTDGNYITDSDIYSIQRYYIVKIGSYTIK